MIRNKTGPLSTESSVVELKAALTGPPVQRHRERLLNDPHFWPLEERLSNMEEYLQIHNKSEIDLTLRTAIYNKYFYRGTNNE